MYRMLAKKVLNLSKNHSLVEIKFFCTVISLYFISVFSRNHVTTLYVIHSSKKNDQIANDSRAETNKSHLSKTLAVQQVLNAFDN